MVRAEIEPQSGDIALDLHKQRLSMVTLPRLQVDAVFVLFLSISHNELRNTIAIPDAGPGRFIQPSTERMAAGRLIDRLHRPALEDFDLRLAGLRDDSFQVDREHLVGTERETFLGRHQFAPVLLPDDGLFSRPPHQATVRITMDRNDLAEVEMPEVTQGATPDRRRSGIGVVGPREGRRGRGNQGRHKRQQQQARSGHGGRCDVETWAFPASSRLVRAMAMSRRGRNPHEGNSINWRAGCGRSARPIRRQGRLNSMRLPDTYVTRDCSAGRRERRVLPATCRHSLRNYCRNASRRGRELSARRASRGRRLQSPRRQRPAMIEVPTAWESDLETKTADTFRLDR